MGTMTFSKLQEKQYKEILIAFKDKNTITLDDADYVRLRETIGILEVLGYIQQIDINGANVFQKIGRFSDFDKWHKDKKREERKLSTRELKIGLACSIIGALIGLLPFVVTTVIPWIASLT